MVAYTAPTVEATSEGRVLTQDSEIAALVERLGVGSPLTGALLLVDDEQLNLRVLRGFLEDRWKVHEAGSGAEALALAAQVPLDVVVADHRMPGMTGVELLEALRQRRPDLAGIVLTGHADMTALESAINRANAFRFLRKPWEPAEIIQAIEQACAHVAQRRTIERLVSLLAQRSEALHASLEELRAQQQALLHLERLGTIGRLASGVTHDLRNVMIGLRTVEWQMEQSTESPALRELLGLGLRGVDNLLKTLQTLHEFSRTGSLELKLEPVDVGEVVTDAVTISRMDPSYAGRDVRCTLPAGLPRARVDRQKLTQVLVNLLLNGLQATPPNTVVWVGARAVDGTIELAVQDAGPGIAPELRERLFQPFVSGKGDGGLGMGLYMARLIVESHRGRIGVRDDPQGGACFEVVLPAMAGEGAE
jgi:signal transduction histidine kinase